MRPLKLLVVSLVGSAACWASSALADPPMMSAHMAMGGGPPMPMAHLSGPAMAPMPGGGGGGMANLPMPGFGSFALPPGMAMPNGMMMAAPVAAAPMIAPAPAQPMPMAHATAPMAVDQTHRGAAVGPVGTRPEKKKLPAAGNLDPNAPAPEAAMPSAPDTTIRGLMPSGPKAKSGAATQTAAQRKAAASKAAAKKH